MGVTFHRRLCVAASAGDPYVSFVVVGNPNLADAGQLLLCVTAPVSAPLRCRPCEQPTLEAARVPAQALTNARKHLIGKLPL